MFEFDFIQELIKTLEDGGVILYPTDTVWAIGCDATNPVALQKLLALKNRPAGKGVVLLVEDLKMLGDYVSHIPPRIDMLLVYHTRPLTVVYEEAENLPKEALGPKGSVAIRVATDSFCKNIVQKFGKPIVATTANLDTEAIPLSFGSISSEVLQGVDYVVRYRREERKEGELSVMAKMGDDGELSFIRE